MSVAILDPSKLSLTILGCKVEGFHEGSFVTIENETQTFNSKTSLKGSKLIGRQKNGDYHFTFRLDNTAGANTWLHAIHKIQKQYGIVFPVPVIYKDGNGDNSFFCASAVIQEPRVEQGNEVYPTEWQLICPKVLYTIGGNTRDQKIADTLRTVASFISLAEFAGIDVTGLQDQASMIYGRAKDAWRNLF